MAKKSNTKWYNDLSYLIKVIIAIILPLGGIVHAIVRLQRGHILAAILCFIIPIFWVIDLVTTILKMPLLFS